MKKRLLMTLLGSWLMATSLPAQTTPEVYRLYDGQGKPVTYEAMLADLTTQDVVFVGEMHNCVICHWMERRLLQALHQAHGDRLAVGMEMFEADDQLVIDEYLGRQITADRFEAEARFWPNYDTDYAPLVDYAYEHRLPLLATNVPRRYANMVKNHGLGMLDSLSDEAKHYLPPLPIPYRPNEQASEALGMMAMMGRGTNPEWLAQSQAVKDATMAWHIAQWVAAPSGKGKAKGLESPRRLVHFNGNYHTDSGEGIPTYLKDYRPEVKSKTLYSVRQEDITTLEEDYLGRGDYILCVTEDMTTSY